MAEYRIIVGDCIAGMATLPAGSVHCCISSPPYFALRDYGVAGQIGLEETPDAYVARIVEVYRAVWRVLRDDGTCWVNLGDSYAGSWSGNSMRPQGGTQRPGGPGFQPLDIGVPARNGVCPPGTKPKDLVGIPWMVAFALRADGWYLRSDIVWSKPNPMPESVTDRPTKAHEYIFLLSKQPRYYFDAEAIKETAATEPHAPGNLKLDDSRNDHASMQNIWGADGKRNRRSVWHIATQPYAEAHFATYPEKLVEPMVLAGTSERGCCPECGAPWRRVTAKDRRATRPGTGSKVNRASKHEDSPYHEQNGLIVGNRDPQRHTTETRTVGWEATCEHGHQPVPATVLDPFTGSGTTGVVACGHGRNFVGTELNPEYAAMARRRIGAVNPLLVREAS